MNARTMARFSAIPHLAEPACDALFRPLLDAVFSAARNARSPFSDAVRDRAAVRSDKNSLAATAVFTP
jgi:hypothetical protein